MGHELVSDLFRKVRIDAACNINCRQFSVLAFVIRLKFLRSRASSACSLSDCE
jgi:hypothetical protein